MTFLQIINLIKDTALAQPNVNTVVRQFIDLNREDTVYSAVVIQDRDGLRDRISEQDWNTYTFHLGYVDRLTYDESNRDDIFSTGINIINNIIASIREVWWPDVEVNIIDRFQTFDQRFTASCAGVYVVLAIQVPVSDCVDPSEGNIFDSFSVNISNNGHYHFVPDGRPVDEIDITVDVDGQKPEDSLVETITSNGSYSYTPEEGRVYGDAAITVAVPGPVLKLWRGYQEIDKTTGGVFVTPSDIEAAGADGLSGVEIEITVQAEDINRTITSNGTYEYSAPGDKYIDSAYINVSVPVKEERHLIPDTITENGEFHYTPPGFSYVYDFAEIEVDVHPSERLVESITSNGSYHYEDDYAGADITVAVPEPTIETLVDTITSNGRYYSETGRPNVYYGSVDLSISVHPSTSLVESITSNGSYHYTGEWNGADITVAVSAAKPEETLSETITSNGSYSYSPTPGSVFSSVALSVDVHPSNTLSRTYTTNGTKTITGEFNGGTVTISVHPSTSLSRTYINDGVYNITGDFSGGTITVQTGVPTPANNEIYYVTYTGNVIDQITNVNDFGANLISNTVHSSGKYCILTFDGPVLRTGYNSFANKLSLKEIYLPDSVTEISQNCFGNTGLQKCIMQNNVTVVKGFAFTQCYALVSPFRLSTGCTVIGDFYGGTFGDCTALSTITIPGRTTDIGPGAFRGCLNLFNIIVHPTTPPTLALSDDQNYHQFDDCSGGFKIRVPADSLQAYKTAPGWSEWEDHIIADDNQ